MSPSLHHEPAQTQAPMPLTPEVAAVRLAQYSERTSTWSTATYNDGTEKALHEIALTLQAEVDRLRTENATIEAKTRESIAQDFIRQGKASDSLSWGQAVSIARDGLCACSGGIKPCDMGGAA